MNQRDIARIEKRIKSISTQDIIGKERTLSEVRHRFVLLEKLIARLPSHKREQVLCALFYELYGLIGTFRIVLASLLTAEDKRAAMKSGDSEAIREVLERSAAFVFKEEHEWL